MQFNALQSSRRTRGPTATGNYYCVRRQPFCSADMSRVIGPGVRQDDSNARVV